MRRFLLNRLARAGGWQRRVMRLWALGVVTLLILSVTNILWEPGFAPRRVLAQATADASGLLPCSAGAALRLIGTPAPQTPVPTATTDPKAPTPTPRPPTPTLLPAPTVDNVGFPKDYQSTYKLLFVLDRPGGSFRVICGNDVAAAWKPGQPFAEGSIMTMDVYGILQS